MSGPQKSNLGGAGYALLAYALYSTHDVVVKTLGANYAAFQIIFFSVLLSFPLVMLMLMRDTEPATLIPVHPWWSALRTLAALVTGVCVFYAFSVLPLAQVYAILFTAPLLVTVLSIPILGEKVGPHRWGAVVVGLIGVLVVLRPGSATLSLGHLAAIVGAVSSSLASIIVRKIGRDERNAVLLLYPMMANFIVMAALLALIYRPMPAEHLGLVGVMAVLSFIAGILLIKAFKMGDAAIVAPMQYSQMIWAAIYGALFFSESTDRLTWIGAGIIIASGIYIVLRESLRGTSAFTPVLLTRTRAETGTSPRLSVLQKIALARPVRPH